MESGLKLGLGVRGQRAMVGVLMGRARVADGSGQALVSPVTPAPRFIGCGWALLTGHVLEGLGDDSGGVS